MRNLPEGKAVILAIDSSMGACSVALRSGGRLLASLEEPQAARQAERLVPMIGALLDSQRMAYRDIGAIACTVGPGSFTGIRIGMAAAKGMALTLGIHAVGVSTLACVAWDTVQDGGDGRDVVAILDASRAQVYAQRFRIEGRALHALEEPGLFGADRAGTLPALAEGAGIAGNPPDWACAMLPPGSIRLTECRPHAIQAAAVAEQMLPSGNRAEFPPFEPLYIRPPDAKLPAPVR